MLRDYLFQFVALWLFTVATGCGGSAMAGDSAMPETSAAPPQADVVSSDMSAPPRADVMLDVIFDAASDVTPDGMSHVAPDGMSDVMSDGPLDAASACVPEVQPLVAPPLDLFVMQDQSGSMTDAVLGGGNKWTAVTGALASFVGQPVSGISIGIQYFALSVGGAVECTTFSCGPATPCATGCGPCTAGFCAGFNNSPTDSCSAADYAVADVEIAPLPGVAATIQNSLSSHSPSTATPTGPALQGAIDHAQAWAGSHPGHMVAAVLSTDGVPDECTPSDQAGVAQIAATGLAGTPSVKTFAVGTFAPADIPSGPNLLNAIAAAGGTGQAFSIMTATQNVSQAFLAALNQITVRCAFSIPAPTTGTLDPSRVNVQYTPAWSSSAETVPNVADQAHCPSSGDGWYYDNDTAPTQIVLCGTTCGSVSTNATSGLSALLGCPTVM